MLVPSPETSPGPQPSPGFAGGFAGTMWWVLLTSPGSGVEFVRTPLKVTPNTRTWMTTAQD